MRTYKVTKRDLRQLIQCHRTLTYYINRAKVAMMQLSCVPLCEVNWNSLCEEDWDNIAPKKLVAVKGKTETYSYTLQKIKKM